VRFLLPIAALITLAFAGCATPQQKQVRAQKKADREAAQENSRALERRRMLVVENGAVNSQRGAEIFVPDPGKAFDPAKATASATRGYTTGAARTNDYEAANHQFRSDTYRTRDFETKTNSAAGRTYATADAPTTGKYAIPNGSKKYGTKSSATKESSDANKTAATQSVWDAQRPYLGAESQKMQTTLDKSKAPPGWTGDVKPMTIDDIRDLLNKSK